MKTKQYIILNLPNEAESLNNYGPLERYQLKFIFQYKQSFLNLKYLENINTEIAYFFLSFGNINSINKPEIFELQRSLENFKKSSTDKPTLFVLLLGIVNHWVK